MISTLSRKLALMEAILVNHGILVAPNIVGRLIRFTSSLCSIETQGRTSHCHRKLSVSPSLSAMIPTSLIAVLVLSAHIRPNVADPTIVSGFLTCGGRPLSRAKVELWEADSMPLDKDDLLATVPSEMNGRFHVISYDHEFGNSEPYIIIKHHCNDGARPVGSSPKFITKPRNTLRTASDASGWR